jgi:hypothetical protein
MTSRSFQYFQKRKVYNQVLRPITMLERQHYGHPQWISDFAQAWERSVVTINHLAQSFCKMGYKCSSAAEQLAAFKLYYKESLKNSPTGGSTT